jgi:hypothetical protein
MVVGKARLFLSILAVLVLESTEAFHTTSFRCYNENSDRSSCSSTIRDTIMDSTLPRDLDSFKTWSEENGVNIVGGLDLSSSNEGDWSLNLSKSLEEAQCLLTIPNSLILSSTKIRKELGAETLKAVDYLKAKNIEEQSHQFYLWIRLLQEYEQGEDSRWHGWMQSMPRTFNSAVSMDEVELECLPPFAWSLAKMVRFHYQTFLEALDMVEEGCIRQDTKSDSELLLWVFNVVFTRCWGKSDFDDENRHDLVPMGDMFNHGEPANVLIDYDEENNDCNIVLKEDVDPSTPLKLSYGHATTPSKFLSIFGFVDLSQPKIFCQIMVSDPSQRHVDMGYDTDKMLFDTRDGGISEEVFDVTLYSILEQIPEIQEKLYQAHTEADKDTKATLHHQYHLETCIMIKKHVDSTLKVLEELSQKSTTLDQSKHPRLETIYRHNVFFQNAFWKVQHQINSMIQEEMQSRRK